MGKEGNVCNVVEGKGKAGGWDEGRTPNVCCTVGQRMYAVEQQMGVYKDRAQKYKVGGAEERTTQQVTRRTRMYPNAYHGTYTTCINWEWEKVTGKRQCGGGGSKGVTQVHRRSGMRERRQTGQEERGERRRMRQPCHVVKGTAAQSQSTTNAHQ